ncbi:hypothetical protein HK414_09195 [Ramlibacter terrae]|uniref:Uncharacterized protein n=1 Tax=Ramlibacter terrae TaxID=2732511 RepID=A0ABX6P3N7_9BURK|nr:hypothetical protein HK414_09195 [Ramlibacter terrae]
MLRSTASAGSQTDAFVTNAGMVYLIGSSGGQWVTPRVTVFNGRTGARVTQVADAPGNGVFYGTQTGVLAASLNKVFFSTQGLSPTDISYFTFNPATSQVTRSGDSPYHGDYAMYPPLYWRRTNRWCSPATAPTSRPAT